MFAFTLREFIACQPNCKEKLEEVIKMQRQPQRQWQEDLAAEEPQATAKVAELHDLLAKARENESEARRELSFLMEVFDQLPFGVIVHAQGGSVLFANEFAAIQLPPGDNISRQASGNTTVAEPLVQGQDQLQTLIDCNTPVTTEVRILRTEGVRTLLATHKPIHVGMERLFLSASIDITDRKEAEEKLVRRANFDELTGLPNRFQLQEHVEAILAQPIGRFALAFIDIDNFKHINDYYSHAIGDALLVKMANRIAENIRPSDILARISGDEFLLVIGPFEQPDDLITVVNSITESLKEPFFIEGFEIFSSASIGVSIFPEHGRDHDTLRRNADAAMYQIKRGTKGAAAIFDIKADQLEISRMRTEQRLRWAIQDRRFRCAFQPKVDVHTEEVVGVEALIRLVDEDGEIYGPRSFVDLAFELGLGDDLTQLAVYEIVKSIDLINAAFDPRISISFNVAAKQASNVDLMRSLVEILKETNCTDRFIAEVTEDAFVATGPLQTQVLPILREAGIRVSIDDFGTGYSALSLLANFTADEIKIDRSFITNIHNQPRNQSIVKAIVSLSDALGMTVVAEGIETFEELAYLRATTRIRYAQGYYFARPLFLENFSSAKHIASHSQKAGREVRNNYYRGRFSG